LITALMMRDYVASRFPAPPLTYAVDYYLHYPKVAIGHWPPGFHTVLAAWMLVFPVSRVSVLLFLGCLTVLLAWLVYRNLRDEAGEVIATSMALLLVCTPLVQRHSHLVMTEVWLALLCFGAALVYGRYLDEARWREALLFSFLAVLAIMSHGRALALGLLPPFALLLGRRLELLRRWSFWFPALPVLAVCGPWHFLVNRKLSVVLGPEEGRAKLAAAGQARFLVEVLGWGVLCLVVLGVVLKLLAPAWRGRPGGKWAALAALVLSTLAFHTLVFAGVESRYLIGALPAMMVLAGAGAVWLVESLGAAGVPRVWATGAAVLAVAGIYGVERFRLERKVSDGYPAIVRELLTKPAFRDSVMLVSARAAREGAFIAEVAMQEQRPGHLVLRASKALARISWSGTRYQELFADAAGMADYLEGIPVGLVAVDTDDTVPRRHPHQDQLLEALRLRSDRWQLLPLEAYRSSRLRVYRLAGHEGRPRKEISPGLDMKLRRVFGEP
jgi:4-amino-4-deoxy-L-arabinose transferase-like glycosyltransferase